MNLAVRSDRSSSPSVPWLCSCKNSLALCKSVRHHQCLQSMRCFIRERKSIIMPLKNSIPVLPTLQQETPRSLRAETSDAPFFFSLQCKQGRFMPRRKQPCACIYKGSAIKCIARKSAGRVYSLKQEVRK